MTVEYYYQSGDLVAGDLNDPAKTAATTASGNFVIDPMLASLGGTDGNLNTPADNDWHLSALSPTSVTQGGFDLSALFTTDFAGATRSLPWSIGAYEY